jgi:glucokinase
MVYIGVDLGGTNIAIGIVNEQFEIIKKGSVPTKPERGPDPIIEDMAALSRRLLDECGLTLDDVEYAGVATPGTANSETGVVEYSNNIPFLRYPMAEKLSALLDGKPVHIENDANAAALGEFLAGSAKGAKNAIAITLGTGVGGGIIIDGKIYSGSNFAGAEIGHTVIGIDGPQCSCGRRGCFEAYSSATGLIRMTKEKMDVTPDSLMHKITEERGGKVSARTSFDAMRQGDKAAKEVVDFYIKALAAGITNTINIFQPDVLCVGGGVCNEGDPLLLPMKALVEKEVYTRNSPKNTKIVIAELGNDAGLIGAAFLGAAQK